MTGIHRSGSVLFTCALMFCLSPLSGCKGGGSSAPAASSTAKASSAGTPTISGTPAASAAANTAYSFKPTASDPDGDVLSFQIENKPAWATFNTVTGELSGTPTLAQAGAFADILISASDGKSSASLSAFSITVARVGIGAAGAGGVALSWTAPTQKSDGSPLNDLAGFVISFGKSRDALSGSVTVDNPSVDRYVFDTLASGTYYFGVRAISASGDAGELSQIVSKAVS